MKRNNKRLGEKGMTSHDKGKVEGRGDRVKKEGRNEMTGEESKGRK